MDNLRVYAKRLGSNEKLEGTGINIFDVNAILYDRYASYEVEPESVVLRRNNQMEKYENPQTDESLTHQLHEKLVQTVLDFMIEHNLNDIDEISFGADSLQVSKGYHKWTPATDSSLTLIGYQDGKRKKNKQFNLIYFVMGDKKIIVVKGISFTTLLFLTFLVLKLTNVINWSWWWVTLPLWITPAVAITIIFLLIILFVAAVFLGKY